MTAEEKTVIADFIDTSLDFLQTGYRRERSAYAFTDDEQVPKKSLPLAYSTPEDEFEYESDTAATASTGTGGLDAVYAEASSCNACALAATRKNVVPGEGVPAPLVLVAGEGPGADEDATGRPFVGRAGKLLDKMLESIGLSREKNCYIANVVKCRPPGNRDPEPAEIVSCMPFLEKQIEALKPKVILCAGRVAARTLFKSEKGITALRGESGVWHASYGDIPLAATYHPSALLRDESLKRPAFDDLKILLARLVEIDLSFRAETQHLLKKYSEADSNFAAKVGDYIS